MIRGAVTALIGGLNSFARLIVHASDHRHWTLRKIVRACAWLGVAGIVAIARAAAVRLFEAGKVDCLIVSGDTHIKGCDEPTGLKLALADAGVPTNRIYCDYAGFRTLDSVVRAKAVSA